MVAAVRLHEHGGPEVLRYEQIALAPPGPGEIRVRQHACGVNLVDTYFRSGIYRAPLPYTLGTEGAGEVLAVGPDVAEFKPGDRVACTVRGGGYAEERNVPALYCAKLPEAIGYDQAAAIMWKGLTAQYLLRGCYPVTRGTTLLIHAAAGGVGLVVVQWAKHLGATIIGTVGSRAKGEIAKAAGCDHVIFYDEEDWVARVAEVTAGRKCDVVYDGIGRATFPGSLDCLRRRGTFVSYGTASGPIEAIPPGILMEKGSLFMTKPSLFDYITTRPEFLAAVDDLFGVIAAGIVEASPNRRYALKDVAQAHRDLESRATTGSSILIP